MVKLRKEFIKDILEKQEQQKKNDWYEKRTLLEKNKRDQQLVTQIFREILNKEAITQRIFNKSLQIKVDNKFLTIKSLINRMGAIYAKSKEFRYRNFHSNNNQENKPRLKIQTKAQSISKCESHEYDFYNKKYDHILKVSCGPMSFTEAKTPEIKNLEMAMRNQLKKFPAQLQEHKQQKLQQK